MVISIACLLCSQDFKHMVWLTNVYNEVIWFMSKPLISVIEVNIHIFYTISLKAEQILQAWAQQRFIHCEPLKNVFLQTLSLQVDNVSELSVQECKYK